MAISMRKDPYRVELDPNLPAAIMRDGKPVAICDPDAWLPALLDAQGQSAEYALTHGGYGVASVDHATAVATVLDAARVTYASEYIGERAEGNWAHRLYLVTLLRPGMDPVTFPYRQGTAYPITPTVEPVGPLACLVSDAESVSDHGTFDDWALSYGYDTDSRKAYQAWQACEATRVALRRLFGTRYGQLVAAVTGY